MKTPTFKNCIIGTLIVLLVILSGWTAHTKEGGVTQIYKNAIDPFNAENRVDSAITVPEITVLANIRYQGGPFWTESRKDKVERFKCSECHNNKTVTVDRAAEMAHGVIVLNHGSPEKPLSCFTCHKEDERNFLEPEKGVKVDMDHSYQLCGQCHFRQKKDWVGGAHGKRLSYWAGKRVVKNCTSCHDPHSPLFKKRWPATYSPPFK
jgi:hypothetical protein